MTHCHARRRLARRAALPALGGALAVVAAVALPASAASPVGSAKVLSKNVATSADTYVSPLVSSTNTSSFGGKTFAVYERHNVEGRVIDRSGQLVAVPNGGKPQVFGVVTPDMYDFSLAGYTLTAADAADATRVYWWQPPYLYPNREFQTGTLGTGDRYVSSAPDGWVEIASDGTLYDVDAGAGQSSAKPLGDPFGSATGVEGIAGPTGVVVWNSSKIAFVSFGTSHAVTPLDATAIPSSTPGATSTPTCWSATSAAVACGTYYNDGEDDSGIKTIFIDPLDGAPAYATSSNCPAEATLLGSTAAWVSSCNGKLILLGESGSKTIGKTFNGGPVAGLGGYLFAGDGGHSGVKLSSAGTRTTTVLPSTHAVSEASGFALTSSSVVWAENDKSATATIHRRSAAPNQFQTGIKAGKTKALGSTKVTKGSVAATGSSVAYATKYTNSAIGQNGSETLRVVTPTRSATINGVDRYLTVALGDHRVLYFTDNTHARLYNLNTRKTAKLAAAGAALDGKWLAYCGTDGVVRLKNLDSGTVRQVATGATSLDQGEIYVHGQVVGWNAYSPDAEQPSGYYRDLAKGDGTVQLPATDIVWSVTDAGVVLEDLVTPDDGSTPFFPAGSQLRGYGVVRFRLQAPGAAYAPTVLLTGKYLSAGPQIAHGVIAWVDQYGKLRARTLA